MQQIQHMNTSSGCLFLHQTTGVVRHSCAALFNLVGVDFNMGDATAQAFNLARYGEIDLVVGVATVAHGATNGQSVVAHPEISGTLEALMDGQDALDKLRLHIHTCP